MNRRLIATNARALPGVDAFVCASAWLMLVLIGFTQADSRDPGEGDLASP
jgi:hypothetical protein